MQEQTVSLMKFFPIFKNSNPVESLPKNVSNTRNNLCRDSFPFSRNTAQEGIEQGKVLYAHKEQER